MLLICGFLVSFFRSGFSGFSVVCLFCFSGFVFLFLVGGMFLCLVPLVRVAVWFVLGSLVSVFSFVPFVVFLFFVLWLLLLLLLPIGFFLPLLLLLLLVLFGLLCFFFFCLSLLFCLFFLVS